MKTVRSDVIGYCFGVSRTIENASMCVRLAAEKGCPCYSIGDLIHNGYVVEHFRQHGMNSIMSPEGVEPGLALVRAHGIPDWVRRDYIDRGFELVDSTCPIVAKGAELVRKAARRGRNVVILGVKGHAETLGLQGAEVSPGVLAETTLVCTVSDAEDLVSSGRFQPDDRITVVTQTTLGYRRYEQITGFLKARFSDIEIANAPCGASRTRIDAVLKLAGKVPAIVVVGGRNSENTKVLAFAAQSEGGRVFRVETASDIDEAMKEELKQYECVGICSGSSTPEILIAEVEWKLQEI